MSIPDPPPGTTRRLFHENAYLRDFRARVIDCVPSGSEYQLVLEQTAFYAASGGQPHDLGTLWPLRPEGGEKGKIEVREVTDEGGVIRHRVSGPVAGDVEGAVDWDRRFDHMQQHTGQHILSQSFIREAGAETVSFHLGSERVTIDVSRADLTDGEIGRAEALANRIVQEDREVLSHWTTREAIGAFPLRKPPQVDGPIRIIEVKDFDLSACGGTHVARTGEIGLIKILRREKYKGGTRVEFVCGRRAIEDYRLKHNLLRSIAERASIQDREVGDLVQRLEAELRASRKRLRELEEARLEIEAERLSAAAASHGGYRLVREIRTVETPDELKFLALRVRAWPGPPGPRPLRRPGPGPGAAFAGGPGSHAGAGGRTPRAGPGFGTGRLGPRARPGCRRVDPGRPHGRPGMIYLTRRAQFCAAHRLNRPELSDQENLELFGKCATPGGHGHNYAVEVTVAGEPDPSTGMVVDLKKVKQVLHHEVIDAWDHRDLNTAVPALRGVIPTAENLAIAIWNALEGKIEGARLHRVRLFETDNNYVDYFGPVGREGI